MDALAEILAVETCFACGGEGTLPIGDIPGDDFVLKGEAPCPVCSDEPAAGEGTRTGDSDG